MIINTVKKWYTGGGSPTVYFANQNFNINANGVVNVSCPVGSNVQVNQSMPGPVRCGYFRTKTEGNANYTARVMSVIGDDGNANQVLLYAGDPVATAANVAYDIIEEFNCDLLLQNINIAINIGGLAANANAVLSVEVAAGP